MFNVLYEFQWLTTSSWTKLSWAENCDWCFTRSRKISKVWTDERSYQHTWLLVSDAQATWPSRIFDNLSLFLRKPFLSLSLILILWLGHSKLGIRPTISLSISLLSCPYLHLGKWEYNNNNASNNVPVKSESYADEHNFCACSSWRVSRSPCDVHSRYVWYWIVSPRWVVRFPYVMSCCWTFMQYWLSLPEKALRFPEKYSVKVSI